TPRARWEVWPDQTLDDARIRPCALPSRCQASPLPRSVGLSRPGAGNISPAWNAVWARKRGGPGLRGVPGGLLRQLLEAEAAGVPVAGVRGVAVEADADRLVRLDVVVAVD